MFEALKEQESEVLPGVQQFLALYTKFTAGAAWLAKRQAEGLDNRPHLADFRRLECRVDALWAALSQEERDCLAKELFPDAGKVMDMFGGHAVKISHNLTTGQNP